MSGEKKHPPKITYIWIWENWMTEEILSWRVTVESMEALMCTNNWGGVSGATGSELDMQESNKILLLIMNTRRLNQILCSVLHTGTCLTVSKGRRIYPGARCFTGRESDLTLFDCQQKMTSALFLFLLIHRNYRNNFPCWDTNRRHFKGNKPAINTCFTARINCFPINL